MVKFISSWAEQIVLAVIIATILEMILPNGKSKKYIKTVIAIYVLFCIISPFIKTDLQTLSNEYNIENYLEADITQNEEINQDSMDKRLQELYLEELQSDVTKTVEGLGFNVKKCNVEAELFNEEEAGIKKIELTVEKNSSNIAQVEKVEISINTESVSSKIDDEDKIQLKKDLASHYEISEDIVTIN